ncbi:hypothetical protein [Actinomadura rayongensis]|uniref:Uncharacterized protein n=1 Tax=Actinomadura rayongensis TaxID=1429076 RepID=A0A6I4W2J9_9ACTN|nr:hypothetical protein [Actinomadura rayongensis]MXQ64407.1 hypothetical protein [Actinomadura rayongensis]
MNQVLAHAFGVFLQADALLMDAREIVGLAAALAAALLAGVLGWQGTDRFLSWRGR